ncbi:substrate-binding periplasmic protein [Marinomonas atlantica]|uniref:substrate-binding periplasmic protein n=1 Tax=Marinomonas atlantica TaxID=1806668 RepID=UPI000831AD72|nr:transporter substrate-binding domain-containing protein [Marinomonas atlantica]MCO4786424.1 transporter substrate-binding domain-containing protein [Marinomonas atlantica]
MRTLAVALSALLFSVSSCATESLFDESSELQGMTVRLCGTPAYPPVSWVTSSGRVEGVNAMLVRTLLNSFGVSVDDRQSSNWRRCLKEVELGNVDVMTGFRTEARTHYMVFLDTPLVKEDINLFYPASEPIEFNGWAGLSGKSIGVLMGDSFGDRTDAELAKYPRLEWVSSQDQNLLKLADRRLDAVPMGKRSGQLQIDVLGLAGQIDSVATDVSDYWYIAISKHSPLIKWLPELNSQLNVLLSDPKLIPLWMAQQRTMYLQSAEAKTSEKDIP